MYHVFAALHDAANPWVDSDRSVKSIVPSRPRLPTPNGMSISCVFISSSLSIYIYIHIYMGMGVVMFYHTRVRPHVRMSLRRILHTRHRTFWRVPSPSYTLLLCRCPGLSQRIEDVTVDWSDYTGIFDGFEVQWHVLVKLFVSRF